MTPLQLSLSLLNDKRRFAIRRKSPKVWYFVDIHPSHLGTPVIWTPYLKQACVFVTEEDVEEFKYAYLRTRPCEIIEIKS